ncbi:glycosyltransferase family 2 protein [Pedobacter sp. ASV28]|uniref:glycosyltransferase family 2 protein n=1 Tax=Pedobacter sp. ASV28 TaxID=2795123 RepID=UPI0018EB81EE|nr:glycosyltransferase family 2 protein [Pedobacter sp. ASV28]
MLLSIITVNLNNAHGLEQTISSVAYQKNTENEHIVIDGASTDESVNVIKKYQKHISYSVSEKDNGIYHAMNKGIRQSKGKYLLFLNSGDTLYHNNVLTEITERIKNKAVSIFYTDANFVDKKQKLAWIKTYPEEVNDSFFIKSSLCHQTMLIEKYVFEQIGLYNQNYQLAPDWMFSFDAFKKGYVFEKLTQTVLSNYVLNGFSANYKLSQKERQSFLQKCYPEYLETYNLLIRKKGILQRVIIKASKLIGNFNKGHKQRDYLKYIDSLP